MQEPDSVSIAQSQQLCCQISKLIQAQNNKISFAEFMQQALYAPGLGYYSAGTTKFGASGDFMTAPELGSLFAQCVAKQCAQILSNCASPTILELGAGSGQLACDLLLELAKLNINLNKYLILELSVELQQRQQQKISQQCPDLFNKVQWLSALPNTPINGVILANEVLDAMPVNKFQFYNSQLEELFVTEIDHKFKLILQTPSTELENYFKQTKLELYLKNLTIPYISEINLWLPAWIKSLSASLNSGAILLFDYGFGRIEYYHPQRNTGTLMCHYQQQNNSDPFWYPGLQDITAHVDFTAIAEAAAENGLEIDGYTNLSGFLINTGITAILQDTLIQATELNILTSPAEMGELFKAMILTKDYISTETLIGFRQFDKLHSL